MISAPRLHALVERFAGQRLLVVGDLMLDEFVWGRVSRISPEAPVPVVEVSRTSSYPGGAANVARNLREFTAGVEVMGLVGACPQGEQLRALLAAGGVGTDFLQADPGWQTIVKTRVIARQQHVVRVDRERPAPPGVMEAAHRRALAQLAPALAARRFDALILEDYGKGFFAQPFVDAVTGLAAAAGTVVAVDPNGQRPLSWRGVTAVKPNRAEAFQAAGRPARESPAGVAPDQDEALLEVGRILLERWGPRHLLVTLGEQGMLLFRADRPPYLLPTRAREVFDLSGAGDTAVALFTLALVAGAEAEEAAEIANHAAGVVVGKLGTATLSPAELLASFERDPAAAPPAARPADGAAGAAAVPAGAGPGEPRAGGAAGK